MSKEEEKAAHGKRLNSSLGWLTQSTSQPKKRKEITGVSAASLVALKSQLAKKQEEISGTGVRHAVPTNVKARHHGGGGGSVSALLQRSNPGVSERDRVDRLAVKANTDRLTESHAALERKAALYDRLSSGHTLDDEEAARYEVDFSMKEERNTDRDDRKKKPSTAAGTIRSQNSTQDPDIYTTTGSLLSEDMRREQQRRAWEESIDQEQIAAERAEERRELIDELEQQTREGRDRAALARQERQYVENRKRERLKAEFLKKKLEAAKAGAAAAKKGGGGDGDEVG